MLLGLESVQRDVNLGSFIYLHHKLDKEWRLCEHAKVHTGLTHFETILKRQVNHDSRDPKHPSDSLNANVALVLFQSLLPISIYSMQKEFLQSKQALILLAVKP